MTITISGTSGITFPAGGTGNPAGAVVGTSDSQTLTNKTIGSGYAGSTVTSGTAVASTSGTSIDFTSIPSWVKRITVMFNGVSANGTSNFIVQIGYSGGIETTGYSGGSFNNGAAANNSNGFDLTCQNAAAQLWSGSVTLTNFSGNIWCQSGVISGTSAAYAGASGGSKTLSGTLDRVRITTVNGTDTFDAGSINILYE